MPPGRLSSRWPPPGGGGMMTMATTLCPMCGRPVKLIRGVMAEHRSYSWNVEGTRLRVCLASKVSPIAAEAMMTPELRAYYRAERVAFLAADQEK